MKTSVKHYFVGVAITVASLCLAALASGILDGADRAVLRQYYQIRGERQLDSSIAIIYFGNEDITALGGLPLKRNYYALLLSALHDVGASAVGFDIALPEPDREHPEYDQVLSGIVKSSGNIVFSSYFESLDENPAQSKPSHTDPFVYPASVLPGFHSGTNLEKPFPDLLANVTALGHTNITYNVRVPLLINSQQGVVPSFALEALRVGLSVSKNDITVNDHTITLPVKGKSYTTSADASGELAINYAGGISSLHITPVLRFLQEYDEWKSSGATTPHPLKNKIVLVGIIAEGKSMFVQTPFEHQFPSLGIHAMLMDNILSGNILRYSSLWIEWLLSIILGIVVTLVLSTRKQTLALLTIPGLLFLLFVASYLLFAFASYVLTIATPIVVCSLVTIGFIVYKNSLAQETLTVLIGEKERVERLLHEKETSLNKLELHLQTVQQHNEQPAGVELLMEIKRYKDEIASLKTQIEDFNPTAAPLPAQATGSTEFQGIVYSATSPMIDVIAFIKKIAATDAPVLLLGESGTGKELAARAVHQASNRAAKPFVAINCGALTETLLESELFGHEKGAFTGAIREKAGRFEIADQGTILLDEIAETSEAFQVKLLRVLQEGTFERVGGTETHKVNVRVIAATNRDIKEEVTAKRFREDLYYRLNVFTVSLPPLRERKDDIPSLVESFIKLEKPGVSISTTVMNMFMQHDWKGNVRELQSIVRHAIVLAQAEGRTLIRIKDLPKEFSSSLPATLDIEEQILESLRNKQFARSAITETADEVGGLNRGTVAEYFRGYCFKTFVEQSWSIPSAVKQIAGTSDAAVRAKVQKKLEEYLANAIELVDAARTLEENISASKSKTKNLPQRYHQHFEQVLKAYLAGKWKG